MPVNSLIAEVLGDGCTGHCAVSIDDNGTLLTEVHCLLTCHIADIHWYHSFSAIVLSQYCEHSTVVWIWDLKYCQSIGNTAGSV